jgi:methionyl-tRNA synthetase
MTPKEQELIQIAHWLNDPLHATIFAVLAIWVSVWKGIALWKAAKNGSMPWFIALLIVNTLGILEIIYIFFFSKKKENKN